MSETILGFPQASLSAANRHRVAIIGGDWNVPTPQVISIVSPWAGYWARVAVSQTSPASSTNNAANEAIFVPFEVTTRATFTQGFWYNGTVATNAGNVCVAIYDETQNRLATTGAVAASGNSVIQAANFSVAVTLAPGTYYMAISFSASGANATTSFLAVIQHGKACGLYRQAAGVHPLPDPAVFATWTSQVVPVFGVAQPSFTI